MLHWLKIFGQAAKAWNADNAFKHSAAVSFYTLFSLAPVISATTAFAAFAVALCAGSSCAQLLPNQHELEFGLGAEENERLSRLVSLYVTPFRQAWRVLSSRRSGLAAATEAEI